MHIFTIFQSSCENVITVIEELQDWIFVCGTNGKQPRCWKLVGGIFNIHQHCLCAADMLCAMQLDSTVPIYCTFSASQDPRKNNRSSLVVEIIDGSGISPYTDSQNSLSLVVGMGHALLLKFADTVYVLKAARAIQLSMAYLLACLQPGNYYST